MSECEVLLSRRWSDLVWWHLLHGDGDSDRAVRTQRMGNPWLRAQRRRSCHVSHFIRRKWDLTTLTLLNKFSVRFARLFSFWEMEPQIGPPFSTPPPPTTFYFILFFFCLSTHQAQRGNFKHWPLVFGAEKSQQKALISFRYIQQIYPFTESFITLEILSTENCCSVLVLKLLNLALFCPFKFLQNLGFKTTRNCYRLGNESNIYTAVRYIYICI